MALVLRLEKRKLPSEVKSLFVEAEMKQLKSILDKPILQSFLLSNDNTLKKLRNEVLAVPSALFLT